MCARNRAKNILTLNYKFYSARNAKIKVKKLSNDRIASVETIECDL